MRPATMSRSWNPTGQLLQVLALASGARRIVEVGTAIGVSTLYMARALPDGGKVVSFEIDPMRHAAARDYLERAGMLDLVDLRLQDAREGLGSLDGAIDMAIHRWGQGAVRRLPRPVAAAATSRRRAGRGQRADVGHLAEGRSDGAWTISRSPAPESSTGG